jgi:geranylgeranyl diphosphate synthase type II
MYSKEELNELITKGVGNLKCDEEAARLYDPVRYMLSIGGKRLRPLLTLMACNIFSDKPEEALMPAIGLEVFHNFTLVHDDIMDSAKVRRNSPTVHEKWNINQAILSGDVMTFIANEYFASTPPANFMKVFRLYNKTATEVCIGQQMDMEFESRPFVTREEYLRMIELKTAVLLASCLKIGSIIGGASDRDSELMYEFGRNLGLAFQIQDDILDVYGDPAVFGKKTGGDILVNKKTFLLIKAIELATGATEARLKELMSTTDNDPAEKIREVTAIYNDLGVKEIAVSLAGDFIAAAFACFGKVDVSEERKDPLLQLALSMTGREK